jgi:hypothetical protein
MRVVLLATPTMWQTQCHPENLSGIVKPLKICDLTGAVASKLKTFCGGLAKLQQKRLKTKLLTAMFR